MKKIVFSLVVVLTLFIVIIFSLGLKTKKIYDTKDLIGKNISEIDLKVFNENRFFNISELKKTISL